MFLRGKLQRLVEVAHDTEWAVGWSVGIVPGKGKDAQSLVEIGHARITDQSTFDKSSADAASGSHDVAMEQLRLAHGFEGSGDAVVELRGKSRRRVKDEASVGVSGDLRELRIGRSEVFGGSVERPSERGGRFGEGAGEG